MLTVGGICFVLLCFHSRYNPYALRICLLALTLMQAFRWYPAGQTSRPLSSVAFFLSYPTPHHFRSRMNGKGSEVMITSNVHHITSVHRQLSVWKHIYTGCKYMWPHYLWENWLLTDCGGPRKYGLWDAESVTVLGRTFPVSDPWKSTASERPSDVIESSRGRTRIQIAATLICG